MSGLVVAGGGLVVSLLLVLLVGLLMLGRQAALALDRRRAARGTHAWLDERGARRE